MTRIVVIGGTGFAGSRIVAEALARGHEVVTVSRSAPATSPDGARVVTGSILDPHVRREAFTDADVAVGAISPMGNMAGMMREAYAAIAEEAAAGGARLIVIGSYNALRPAPGLPRLVETAELPAEYRALAEEVVDVLDDLIATSEPLRWVYVSPPTRFGAWADVDDTGAPQTGGEVIPSDGGASRLSPADLAIGILDEIEHPTRDREILSLFA